MPRKKTHEEYMAEVAVINPNIEVIGMYNGAHKKIMHRCLIDGYEWEAAPHNILFGKGCPKCGHKKHGEKRAKTHDEYMFELSIKNPNVEVVGKYAGASTKIEHHCLIHDIYWDTTPSRALQGAGCKLCHGEKISATKYKTHEQYVDEVMRISPHIIVIGKYIEARMPILHRCIIHDVEWMAYPDNILRGCGCQKCGNEKVGDKLRKTHEQYVEELKIVNPNVIPLERYIDALTPILHRCLVDNNEWCTAPANVIFGKGCPQCNESSGERRIRLWLENNGIKYNREKAFDDCRDIKPLPFDFYLPECNCCVEYQGQQHYYPVEIFGGEKTFENQQRHDNIKIEYCKENNIPLLCIPYYKDTEEELNNFLFI